MRPGSCGPHRRRFHAKSDNLTLRGVTVLGTVQSAFRASRVVEDLCAEQRATRISGFLGALNAGPSGSRRDIGPGWPNANIARLKDEESTQGVGDSYLQAWR